MEWNDSWDMWRQGEYPGHSVWDPNAWAPYDNREPLVLRVLTVTRSVPSPNEQPSQFVECAVPQLPGAHRLTVLPIIEYTLKHGDQITLRYQPCEPLGMASKQWRSGFATSFQVNDGPIVPLEGFGWV